MGARSKLSTAVDVLVRNKVLFVAALAVWLVNDAGGVVQFVAPAELVLVLTLGVSGLLLFLTPFFEGGLFGMADEGLTGRTSLGTFGSEGASNYLGLLGGRILIVGILLGAYFLVVFLGLFVLFGLGAVGTATGGIGGASIALTAIGLLFLLVGLLVVLTPLFFLQFYGPAIVVNDRGVVASFKESYRLVRANIVSVLGFDAIVLVLYLVSALPTIGLLVIRYSDVDGAGSGLSLYAGISPNIAAGYFAVSLILGVPIMAFVRTYQIAYFADLAGDEP